MGWNIFLGRVITFPSFDYRLYQSELFNALNKKNVQKVSEITEVILKASLEGIRLYIK